MSLMPRFRFSHLLLALLVLAVAAGHEPITFTPMRTAATRRARRKSKAMPFAPTCRPTPSCGPQKSQPADNLVENLTKDIVSGAWLRWPTRRKKRPCRARLSLAGGPGDPISG